jgi:Lipopolysaccharide kinase (Kdo/WaaP) family
MEDFIRPGDADFLLREGLGTFATIWDREDPWFTKPNRGRSAGGWSGVCLIERGGRRFFLKKQENYFCYFPRFPFRELVAEREFRNIQTLDSLEVPSLKVIYFGVRKVGRRRQALLMTESLEDYIPLNEVTKSWQSEHAESHARRRALIASVASMIRQLHDGGLIHNALYAKHIFVHRDLADRGELPRNSPPCRLIDLENCRKISLVGRNAMRDLDSLHRRSRYWSKADRLFFVLTYLKKKRCDAEARLFIQRFLATYNDRRSSKKRKTSAKWRKKMLQPWRFFVGTDHN